jgi:REP element-mobilizing transposase RayT
LKGYDYSQSGAYFVTLVTQNRERLFGEIVNGSMVLNNAGKMVEKWWYELNNKFPNIKLDGHITMPNHFHGIIITVGADLCVCPGNADLRVCPGNADLRVCPGINNNDNYGGKHMGSNGEHIGLRGEHIGLRGEHIGSPLHKIVQWFKTMTTNDYINHVKTNNWKPFNKKLWQRNYYEHIIRNEIELNKIRQYIINNPLNWEKDDNYNI